MARLKNFRWREGPASNCSVHSYGVEKALNFCPGTFIQPVIGATGVRFQVSGLLQVVLYVC